jgi:hypothetical protein
VNTELLQMLTQAAIIQAYSDWLTFRFVSVTEGGNKSRGRGEMRLIISTDETRVKGEGNRI